MSSVSGVGGRGCDGEECSGLQDVAEWVFGHHRFQQCDWGKVCPYFSELQVLGL